MISTKEQQVKRLRDFFEEKGYRVGRPRLIKMGVPSKVAQHALAGLVGIPIYPRNTPLEEELLTLLESIKEELNKWENQWK